MAYGGCHMAYGHPFSGMLAIAHTRTDHHFTPLSLSNCKPFFTVVSHCLYKKLHMQKHGIHLARARGMFGKRLRCVCHLASRTVVAFATWLIGL
jgi:hypothetical protein